MEATRQLLNRQLMTHQLLSRQLPSSLQISNIIRLRVPAFRYPRLLMHIFDLPRQ